MISSSESEDPNQIVSILLHLDPNQIKLWCPDTPVLYSLELSLLDQSTQLCDRRQFKYGFRKFESRETQFFLNNRRFIMRGTNRHEDHPSFGLALPAALQYRDLQLLKETNMNCFRGAHHPNAECVLQFCDELGLLFIEEVPAYALTATQMAQPELLETAKRTFFEIYQRDKNYSCVVAWSLSNESHTETVSGRKFHEQLYQYARSIDQNHHMIIHVSNRKSLDTCYDLSDFITVNIYDGWYSGEMANFLHEVQLIYEIMIDEDHEFGPVKPIVLTEFGAGAIRGYRSWDHAKWSEEFQADFLDYYLSKVRQLEYIGGTWTWMFIDTRVDLPARPDGRPRSYNNKGILDEYRVPKLAFDHVKQWYSKP
jgi:beta-glucuronidase